MITVNVIIKIKIKMIIKMIIKMELDKNGLAKNGLIKMIIKMIKNDNSVNDGINDYQMIINAI